MLGVRLPDYLVFPVKSACGYVTHTSLTSKLLFKNYTWESLKYRKKTDLNRDLSAHCDFTRLDSAGLITFTIFPIAR